MAKKGTKLGDALSTVLHRRTGAEALEATIGKALLLERMASWPGERKLMHGLADVAAALGKSRRLPEGYTVTRIRFTKDQWAWLRRQALERALESGAKADASEIVRELVAAAMPKAKGDPF